MMRRKMNAALQQNVGVVVLFALCIIDGVLLALTPVQFLWEPLLISIGILTVILLATSKRENISIIFAGGLTVFYVFARFLIVSVGGGTIFFSFYFYLIMPFLVAAAMKMFLLGNKRIQLELSIMKERAEELVMISQVSGLYNLCSLHNDLQTMGAYVERHNLSMSLMIVKLEFEHEAKLIFSKERYDSFIKEVAITMSDSVRVEDKVYAIDEDGTFGIILICNKDGSEFVRKRIEKKVRLMDQDENLAKGVFKYHVKIACEQYDKNIFGEDVIRFQRNVLNTIEK